MTVYPRLIYNNLWRPAAALASSPVADPQHPVSDSQIDTVSMFFRASAATTPCTIPVNQGAGFGAIDFVMILAHNIDSDATITLEGDDNAAFDDGGGQFVARTITYNATNIFQFVTTFTRQYVRIQLVAAGANFAAAPQIATILCGSYTEFNRRPQKGYIPGKDDVSGVEESDARVIFAQERPLLDEHKYKLEGLDDTTEAVVLLFLEECGKTKGFVWCMNHVLPNTNSYFVRNSEIINPEYQYPDVWNWAIAMKEIV